ncbi:MAG TPA: HNH endonuclease [Propionicimonas sp.]|jgi:5-methylcytosine-specific restriction protein A
MAADRRQFDWQRDELILACDLISQNEWHELRASDRRVVALSELLRRPWLQPLEGRPSSFRSPSSVARKTSNLATHVPGYAGAPTKGGRLDLAVLRDFLENPATMQDVARQIRTLIAAGEHVPQGFADIDPDVQSHEGRLIESVATARERDGRLRRLKLSAVTTAGLPIACEVCGFDFEHRYGTRGEGYIEVHHRRPLHVSGEVRTRLGDLALLCANCHRMIHRHSWITVEDLKALLRDQ